MSSITATYENLRLTLFEKNYCITEIKIYQKINEHAKLEVTAIIDEDDATEYETTNINNKTIMLIQIGGEKDKVHFNGALKNIILEFINGVYYLHAEGISFTYNIDIQIQNVSYQNITSTFSQVVEKSLREYSFAHKPYIWTEDSKDEATNRFILQFNETDWEFLKRLASIHNLGLIPDIELAGTRFYIGLPKGREEIKAPKLEYRVFRPLKQADIEIDNNIVSNSNKINYISYEIYDAVEYYSLGDVVNFEGKTQIVSEKFSHMDSKDGILKNDYILQPEKGLKFPRLYNDALGGNSLVGTVIDVKRNFTKLHLHIDEKQPAETAFWFPQPAYFTAGSNSGWCEMPERGAQLNLHFSSKDETDHYIISSHSINYESLYGFIDDYQSSEKSKEGKRAKEQTLSDDNIQNEKYLKTPGHNGMLLDDNQIKYHTTGDISIIEMNDGKGIEISSNGNIELVAENIYLNYVTSMVTLGDGSVTKVINKTKAKTIKLKAKEEIQITSGLNSIVMNKEETKEHYRTLESNIYLESRENIVVPIIEDTLAASIIKGYEENRKKQMPRFTPDGIMINADNKNNAGIKSFLFNYWKETSGKYDEKAITMRNDLGHSWNKNDVNYQQWAMSMYGMTGDEWKTHTWEGKFARLQEYVGKAFFTYVMYQNGKAAYQQYRAAKIYNPLFDKISKGDEFIFGTGIYDNYLAVRSGADAILIDMRTGLPVYFQSGYFGTGPLPSGGFQYPTTGSGGIQYPVPVDKSFQYPVPVDKSFQYPVLAFPPYNFIVPIQTQSGSQNRGAGEINPYTDKMREFIIEPVDGFDAFLEKKYIEIRKAGLDDISKVAKNTGLTEQEILNMKQHVFLDTHQLSINGKPYETYYFTADPDIAYAWEAASKGELTQAQKDWFREMANHELGEKALMDQGMPLRDESTWNSSTNRFEVDKTKNAHDAAPPQPGGFPGSTAPTDAGKHVFDDPTQY